MTVLMRQAWHSDGPVVWDRDPIRHPAADSTGGPSAMARTVLRAGGLQDGAALPATPTTMLGASLRPREIPLMTTIRDIVVATDFSPVSDAAVERARQLAEAHEAALWLLHASPHGADSPDPRLDLAAASLAARG